MANKPTVGTACNITTGKLDSNQAVVGGKFPFFTCSEFPVEIDSYAFDDDVVLIAGNNAQGNFHINRFKGKFNAYQRTYVLTANSDFDIDFIYYSLKLELKRLKEKSQGSQTKFLTKPILEHIQLRDINKIEQQNISSILKVIDSKIELNGKINAELESMAKTIYNYWFVQFDFPNENDKPYKSSGGKMVWNENLKRDIPEGWDILELNDIISRCGTGLNPRKNFKLHSGDNYYVTIANIEQNKVILDEKCDRIDDSALKIIDKRSDLQVGDILFTSIQPVGVTYLLQEKPHNWNINESVFTIRPNYEKVTPEYLFMVLSNDEIKVFTENSSAGSVHKGIRHSVLKKFKLAYKNEKIINQFSEFISPLLTKMNIINKENQKLTELRDFLLPMLMNGQVQVVDSQKVLSQEAV